MSTEMEGWDSGILMKHILRWTVLIQFYWGGLTVWEIAHHSPIILIFWEKARSAWPGLVSVLCNFCFGFIIYILLSHSNSLLVFVLFCFVFCTAWKTRIAVNGKCWSQHKWVSILYHLCAHATLGWQARCVWTSSEGHECCQRTWKYPCRWQ